MNETKSLGLLLEILTREIEALKAAYDAAEPRQWEASPVPKQGGEAARSSASTVANPTADIALDPRRLALRDTTTKATAAVRDAVVRVVASRKALERAVVRFDGDA